MLALEKREEVVHKIIETGLLTNDWVVIDFTLKKCWNKLRILNKVNAERKSYLHLATSKNYFKCVRTLIEHGIDIDSKDSNGNTCLHIAVKEGFDVILRSLIEANANPFIRNKDDKLAIDLAKNQKVKEILRKYIVKSSEIKLIRNLKKWKDLFALEDDLLLKENGASSQEKEESKRSSLQDINNNSLKRADSGIVADTESERSFKLNTFNSDTSINESHNKPSRKKSPTSDKAKIGKVGGAILGATLATTFSKTNDHKNKSNEKLNKFINKHTGGFIRSFSAKALTDSQPNKNQTNESIKSTGLRVTPQYADSKKSTHHKRRKINRKERISMPEGLFASSESYI